jgi:hypothetical protein
MHGYNRAPETDLITEWVVVARESLLWIIFNSSQMFLISLVSALTAKPDLVLLKIRSHS